MDVMQGVALGVLFIVPAVALALSVIALKIAARAAKIAESYPKENADVIRVVNQCKEDVESLIDRSEVILGRISRAKRRDGPKVDLAALARAGVELNPNAIDEGGIVQNTDYAAAPQADKNIVTESRQELLARATRGR